MKRLYQDLPIPVQVRLPAQFISAFGAKMNEAQG
jgi:hypothetical protein